MGCVGVFGFGPVRLVANDVSDRALCSTTGAVDGVCLLGGGPAGMLEVAVVACGPRGLAASPPCITMVERLMA